MWRLSTLGGLALEPLERPEPTAGASAAAVADATGLRRPLALLAVLAAAGPRGTPRDQLLLYFWPESDMERARNALKQTRFRLRRELGAQDLVLGTTELRLNPTVVTSDVAEFEAALAAGDVQRAVALYRGPFLHGIPSGRLPEFDQWATTVRAQLAQRFAAAVESLASAAEARGDFRTAVQWWRRLAAADPTSSRVAFGLMTALAAAGDRDGALQYFRLHELLLQEELGAAPDESLLALVLHLRADNESGRGAETPPAQPEVGGAPTLSLPATAAAEPAPTLALPRRRWRRLHLAVPAFAVAAAVVVLVLLLRDAAHVRAGAVAAGPPSVVVLPFAVRAADGPESGNTTDYLREGLVELLSRSLDGAGTLRAVDGHAVLGLLHRSGAGSRDPDPTFASSVAARLDASYVVLGDVTAVGGRLRISATMYDRAGGSGPLRPVGEADVETDTTGLFDAVDRLTLGLLAVLPRPPTERLAQSAALTTASLPALKAYLTGESLYRSQRWTEAMEAFQQAGRIDTAFALAHYRLSMAADWAGRHLLVTPAAEWAYQWSGRLGTHDSLLVHAHRAFRRQEIGEADRLYRTVVSSHPEDVEAWYQLGEVLFHLNERRGRSFTEAREPFTRVLGFDPNNEEALMHLLRIAAHEGQRAEVDSLSRRILSRAGAHHRLEIRAFRAFAIGQRAEVEAALDELRRGNDGDWYVAVWRGAVFARNLDAAERVTRIMVEPSRVRGTRHGGHEMRAELFLAQGRRRAADRELTALAQIDGRFALGLRALLAVVPVLHREPPELEPLRRELRREDGRSSPDGAPGAPLESKLDSLLVTYFLGLASAAAGDSAQALDAAARLTAWASQQDSTGRRTRLARTLAASLGAQVAWRAGRVDDALDLLRPVAEGRATAEPYVEGFDRFVLAELLLAKGHVEEALGWYGSIADISIQNLPYLGPAELRQAQIHDRRGDLARAIAHYRRLVELWRGCDPELRPVVADAERRLTQLGGG